MKKPLKIFIIAGEVSGDVLGGEIMRVAKGGEFSGIGGDTMKKAGLKTLFPISDLSVMGVSEVIRKSKTLTHRIKETADAIIKEKPDIVLSIDSPSFAARVIKKVKKTTSRLSLAVPRFYHVVAPMVWAWGGKRRAKKYARIFDKLFAFFDFEKPYFTKYGLDTVVMGYPIYNVVSRTMKKMKKKYVALLPGSRMGEVSKVLSIYKEFAATYPEYEFAIPVTETTRNFISREIKSWSVVPKLVPFDKRYDLYNQTKFAVSVIGTATAELAIMRTPTVVLWRPGWLTRVVSRYVLKIKWLSLVNIISGRGIYPELLGKRVTARNIAREIENMDMKKITAELGAVEKLWHKKESPMKIVAASLE